MSVTPPRRRAATLALAVGVLSVLPLVALPAASHAEAGCLSEDASGIGSQRCDDDTQPTTSLVSADPVANSAGYLHVDHISIAFSGAYTDADADPMAFQCELYTGSTAPADSEWKSCTSPVSYTDLADTTASSGPYTFRVRSVDTGDNAIDATADGGLFGPKAAATDVPDYDETPAAVSFMVDTTTPNTYVFGEPYDAVTPQHPMLTTSTLDLDLASTESGALFRCTIAGAVRPCASGSNRFAGIKPGDGSMRITSYDLAGNTDASPVVVPYAMPTDLKASMGRGFRTVKADGAFGGYRLVATKPGAYVRITVPKSATVNEIRVLGPVGRGLGRMEVQLAKPGHAVALPQDRGTSRALTTILQRNLAHSFSGTLTFKVLKASASKPAIIDAVLVH